MATVSAGTDSIQHAAHQIALASGELFVLFGGRPRRPVHSEEPTIWIDVYDLDGAYDRSYWLPFDSKGMATDGQTFYVVSFDPYPALLGLRPRER